MRVVGSPAAPDSDSLRGRVARRGPVERHALRRRARRARRLWLSGNAGLMRFDPETRRRQDLSSRARPAGRGVLVRRVLPPARRPRVLRRPGRLQHLRSRDAVARSAQPPRARADERRSARRARRRRDAVLAARSHRARLSRQHRLARLRRARFQLAEAQPARLSHGRASRTTGSISARSGASRSPISMPAITCSKCAPRMRIRCGARRRCSSTIHRDPAPWRSPWAYAVVRARSCSASSLYRVHRQRLKFREMVRARERLEVRSAAAHARAASRATASSPKRRARRATSSIA